ncbi:unnamed protein product [Arabidopsis lyrata]|nr:unnamed protein product [Arabidopsis lyrata]
MECLGFSVLELLKLMILDLLIRPLCNPWRKRSKNNWMQAESVSVKNMSVDGRRVCINVLTAAFMGKSSVNRQRMMYDNKDSFRSLKSLHKCDQSSESVFGPNFSANNPEEDVSAFIDYVFRQKFSETGGRKSKERRNLAAIPSRHGSNKDRDRDNSLWTARVEVYRQCLAHRTQEAHGSTKRLIRSLVHRIGYGSPKLI